MDCFIVGTGRCGSTLLSRMLAENPAVLSIFEFFNGLDVAKRFGGDSIEGEAFAALIASEQPFVTAVLRRGYEVSEITYPFGSGARYRRDDPLPWILVSALSRLASDPDSLFDETVAFASGLPRQHLAIHYRALFDWLCARMGRERWIERSGSSIDYLAGLHGFFSGARFLHIHRDGCEAALSMREHHAYRLPIALMYGPTGTQGTFAAGVDLHAAPAPGDPISSILGSRPSVEYYGRYWCDQVRRGAQAWRALAAEQFLAVRFEDLVTDPRQVLGSICEFFELDPMRDGWIDRAVGLVRSVPPKRFDQLSAAEQTTLSDACRPGQQLLGRG